MMQNRGKILEGQIFQTLFALIAALVFVALVGEHHAIGRLLLVLAVLSSLVHQLWVAFFWRLPLYSKVFRGAEKTVFSVYRVGFVLFSMLRIASILLLSYLDKASFLLAAPLRFGVAAILLALSSYGMYTVTVLFIYIISILFQSKRGLGMALFHHIHLWIHYFCTERIDLYTMYAKER